jgi:hypothetical protein
VLASTVRSKRTPIPALPFDPLRVRARCVSRCAHVCVCVCVFDVMGWSASCLFVPCWRPSLHGGRCVVVLSTLSVFEGERGRESSLCTCSCRLLCVLVLIVCVHCVLVSCRACTPRKDTCSSSHQACSAAT